MLMAGSIFLSFAFVSSILSMTFYFLSYKGYKNTINLARVTYTTMTMLVIMASAYLLYLILTHRYDFLYVYSYSNSDLPIGYLIATFWAGQEGSFLLWLLLTAIVGVFLQSYSTKFDDLEPRVMMIYSLATTFLLAMVSPLLKDPFALTWAQEVFIPIKNIQAELLNLPIMASFIFQDNEGNGFVKINAQLVGVLQGAGLTLNNLIAFGKGLNPLLQNFWMQIHPPILFTGFSMATIPFVFAIAAMLKNDYSNWVKQSFPWLLGFAGVMGLGIMLGGYWAYGILGWGGYWAWDPVENSSLVPWLISVAAIHTMLVQQRTQGPDSSGRFAKTNIILSISVFVFVLYSTFLTRSGILGDASVHSFVDPGTTVYIFLVVFTITFLALGVGMVIWRWNKLAYKVPAEDPTLSRELSLFTAAITLGASAIVVVTGTSAPIFKQSVDISFYNQMHVPLAIIIGLLNGVSLMLKWKVNKGKEVLKKSLVSFAIAAVITLAVVGFGGVYDIMMILLTFAASFMLVVNAQVAYTIVRKNPGNGGAYIAHTGLALFILGVIGSSAYDSVKDVELPKGETVSVHGYSLTFTGYTPFENNSKYMFNIDVKKSDITKTVNPVMYISDFNNSLMREPDIWYGVAKDFYIEPLSYNPNNQAAKGHEITLNPGEKTGIHDYTLEYIKLIRPEGQAMMSGGDFKLGLQVAVSNGKETKVIEPYIEKKGAEMLNVPMEIPEFGVTVGVSSINPTTKVAILTVEDKMHPQPVAKETIVVQASVKPFVNFVWLGTIVMVAGFLLSMGKRYRQLIQKDKKTTTEIKSE